MTKQQVEAYLGICIEWDLYNIFTGICGTAKSRYAAEEGLLGLAVSQSFRTWKKGSRRFKTEFVTINKYMYQKI
jgi:hypothetical protein